jgi:hypothetical protein
MLKHYNLRSLYIGLTIFLFATNAHTSINDQGQGSQSLPTNNTSSINVFGWSLDSMNTNFGYAQVSSLFGRPELGLLPRYTAGTLLPSGGPSLPSHPFRREFALYIGKDLTTSQYYIARIEQWSTNHTSMMTGYADFKEDGTKLYGVGSLGNLTGPNYGIEWDGGGFGKGYIPEKIRKAVAKANQKLRFIGGQWWVDE